MTDTIRIEVLADGTIKTTTDPISGPNHQSAEAFLGTMAALAGGATTRQKRSDAQQHTHAHVHTHADGTTHSH